MMIKQQKIQKFILDTLKNDSAFTALCTTELGSVLNFYKDSSIRENNEVLPCLISHKLYGEENLQAPSEYMTQFLIIAEMPKDTDGRVITEAEDDGTGIFHFGITDKVENVTMWAVEIIKCALRDLGIDGNKDLYITKISVLISEIGEADDVMATVTMTIEEQKFLNQ